MVQASQHQLHQLWRVGEVFVGPAVGEVERFPVVGRVLGDDVAQEAEHGHAEGVDV